MRSNKIAERPSMSTEFADTPRTRLAMLRVGVVPELFDQLAPTLQAQLHLERELCRIRESVMSERDDIIAHGVSELEFAALGCPRSLEKYKVSGKSEVCSYSETRGFDAADEKYTHCEASSRKLLAQLPTYVTRSPRKHLYVPDELIRYVNYRKDALLASQHKEREDRLKKTIEAYEFAYKVIRERLDLRHQEFLQRRAKAQQLHSLNYARYYEEYRKTTDRLRRRFEGFDEKCIKLRYAHLEAQYVKRQMALVRNRDAQAHYLVAYYLAKQRLEVKRQHLQIRYERSSIYKQLVLEQKSAHQMESSARLSQSVAKAERFRADQEEIKRYKYAYQYEKVAERILLCKSQNLDKRSDRKADECVRYFLFYQNKAYLERYEEYYQQQIVNRLLKPVYMNFSYTAPLPQAQEKEFCEEDELIESIIGRQGKITYQTERPFYELCNDIRKFRRSPDLYDYVGAIQLARYAAERLKKETASMMAKI